MPNSVTYINLSAAIATDTHIKKRYKPHNPLKDCKFQQIPLWANWIFVNMSFELELKIQKYKLLLLILQNPPYHDKLACVEIFLSQNKN